MSTHRRDRRDAGAWREEQPYPTYRVTAGEHAGEVVIIYGHRVDGPMVQPVGGGECYQVALDVLEAVR